MEILTDQPLTGYNNVMSSASRVFEQQIRLYVPKLTENRIIFIRQGQGALFNSYACI